RNGVSGAIKPRLSAEPRLPAAARNSGKVSQSQVIPWFSTSNGIASTLTRSRVAISRASGRHGAIPTPQFPMTTEVTPCQEEGEIAGSRRHRQGRPPSDSAAPAQGPFLDAVPGQPGQRQGDRQRAEEHLPPRGTPARQPHDQLLGGPAIDVETVGEVAAIA